MIVIVDGVRTAMGGFQGSLSSCTAPELGAVTIKEVLNRSGLQPTDVDEVILGCVLPAGLKQGPARQQCVWQVYLTQRVQQPSIKFAALV